MRGSRLAKPTGAQTVPARMPSSSVHRRRRQAPSVASGSICQRLVSSEGSSSSTAPWAGGMNRPSRPMATVGRPRPTTPLTRPASAKVAAMARCSSKLMPRSVGAARAAIKRRYPQPAFGPDEMKTPTDLGSTPLRFDLVDLRLFLHILEAGSMTVGSQRAHLALASASAPLRAIEAGAGQRLFERHRSGVTPTPAGLALAHHARLV